MEEKLSIHHEWKEISDLPADLEPFRDRELESLCQVWNDRKKEIGESETFNNFSLQLAREWAIETGIIEGVYTLDRGITQTLIERGIDSSYIPHGATNHDPELVARTIQAHAEVLDGLFAFIKGERALTTGYIKELHAALLRYQDTVVVFDQVGNKFEKILEKGAYKTQPNNPRRPDGSFHEYCPPEHVASEMDRLIVMHREHERRGVRTHLEAAWLHHAFTQIHPFQDGNGRVARALASLVFIKDGFFPLVIHRDIRERYIDGLETADRGDLKALVFLFAQVQKKALTKAIGTAAEVKSVKSIEEAVAVTRGLLVDLGKMTPPEYLAAIRTADELKLETIKKLNSVAANLRREIADANPSFRFLAGPLNAPLAIELRALAAQLDYDPNSNYYNAAAGLLLGAAEIDTRINIYFHGVGSAFRGLLVAVAYLQIGTNPPIPLSDDIFRISYEDSPEEIIPRYLEWLDAAIIRGLAEWRKTLV